MSHMNHNAAFATAEAIHDLSFEEINEVSGGFPVAAAIAAVAAVVTAVIAYATSTSSDDCTTTKSYDKNGREVKSVTVCD